MLIDVRRIYLELFGSELLHNIKTERDPVDSYQMNGTCALVCDHHNMLICGFLLSVLNYSNASDCLTQLKSRLL